MYWCCCGPTYTTRCATFGRCRTQLYPDVLYLTTGLGTLTLTWNSARSRWVGSRVISVANALGDFTVVSPGACTGGTLATRDVTVTYEVSCPGDVTSLFFNLVISAAVAQDGGGTWRYLGDGWSTCATAGVGGGPTTAGPGCISPLTWSGTLSSTWTRLVGTPPISLSGLDTGSFALTE